MKCNGKTNARRPMEREYLATLNKFYLGQRGLSMEARNALGECLKSTVHLGRRPSTEEK